MSLDSPIVPYQIFVSSMNDGIESVLIKNERLTDNVLNFNVSFKEFGYNKLYTKEITSEASKSIDVEVVPFPLFEYSYIGCFSENTTQRVMNYSVPYQSSVNITENCVQKCSGYNFKYAGVSNSQCYCGDEFYSKIPKRKVFRTTEPLIAIFMWGVNYTVSFNKNIFFNKILT